MCKRLGCSHNAENKSYVEHVRAALGVARRFKKRKTPVAFPADNEVLRVIRERKARHLELRVTAKGGLLEHWGLSSGTNNKKKMNALLARA